MEPVYRAPSLPPDPVRLHRPRHWTLVRYVLVVSAVAIGGLTVAGRFVRARTAVAASSPRRVAPRGGGVIHIPAVRRDAAATLDGLAIGRTTSLPDGGLRGCLRVAASVAVDEVRCALPVGEPHLFEVRVPGATADRWRVVLPSNGATITLVP